MNVKNEMCSKEELILFADLIEFPKKSLTKQLINSILNCPIQSEFLLWLTKYIDGNNILNEDGLIQKSIIEEIKEDEKHSICVPLIPELDDLDLLEGDIKDHMEYLEYLEELEIELNNKLYLENVSYSPSHQNLNKVIKKKEKCIHSLNLLNEEIKSLETKLNDTRKKIQTQDPSVLFFKSVFFINIPQDFLEWSEKINNYVISKNEIYNNKSLHLENTCKQRISSFFEIKELELELWDLEADIASLSECTRWLMNLTRNPRNATDEINLEYLPSYIHPKDIEKQYRLQHFKKIIISQNEKNLELRLAEKCLFVNIIEIQKSLINFGHLLIFIIEFFQYHNISLLKKILSIEYETLNINNLKISTFTPFFHHNVSSLTIYQPLSTWELTIPEPLAIIMKEKELVQNISQYYNGPTKRFNPNECKNLIESFKNQLKIGQIKNQLNLLISSSENIGKDNLLWTYFIVNPNQFLKLFSLMNNKGNLTTLSLNMTFINYF